MRRTLTIEFSAAAWGHVGRLSSDEFRQMRDRLNQLGAIPDDLTSRFGPEEQTAELADIEIRYAVDPELNRMTVLAITRRRAG